MRELYFTISEQLAGGLRRDSRSRVNTLDLEVCSGMKTCPFGLTRLAPAAAPGFAITKNWPYPQIFRRGRDRVVLNSGSVVYAFDAGGSFFLQEQSLYYLNNVSTLASITQSGQPWEFVELGKVWFASNGACVVLAHPLNSLGTAGSYVLSGLSVQGICYYADRLILGGLQGSSLFTDRFQSVWNRWKTFVNDFVPSEDELELGNWILYSSRQGGDIRMPFLLELGILNQLDDTLDNTISDFYIKMIEEREIGILYVPDAGLVKAVRPLGEHLIIFGQHRNYAARLGIDGWAFEEISCPAIGERGLLCGDEKEIVYIDREGWLWKLAQGTAPLRLGYKEYLAPLRKNTTVCLFEEEERDFIISSSDKAYVYNNGLGEVKKSLSALVPLPGGFEGVEHRTDDGLVEIVTSPFHLNITGLKTISSVHLYQRGLSNIGVSIYYRFKEQDPWELSNTYWVTDEGVANTFVAGVEFKVRITASADADAALEGIRVQYKVDDKRQIRGAYGIAKQGRDESTDAG